VIQQAIDTGKASSHRVANAACPDTAVILNY